MTRRGNQRQLLKWSKIRYFLGCYLAKGRVMWSRMKSNKFELETVQKRNFKFDFSNFVEIWGTCELLCRHTVAGWCEPFWREKIVLRSSQLFLWCAKRRKRNPLVGFTTAVITWLFCAVFFPRGLCAPLRLSPLGSFFISSFVLIWIEFWADKNSNSFTSQLFALRWRRTVLSVESAKDSLLQIYVCVWQNA